MATTHKGRGRRLMGEINVVPYIDVMLVLLIIFMITAPLLTQGVKVDLPKAGAEPIPPKQNDMPLVLSIDRSGNLYLNRGSEQERNHPLDEDTLSVKAADELRDKPDLTVLLKGDTNVPYGRVVSAMVILQHAGARKIGIVTDPPPRRRGN
jgi:biopolymer transport protein TolR